MATVSVYRATPPAKPKSVNPEYYQDENYKKFLQQYEIYRAEQEEKRRKEEEVKAKVFAPVGDTNLYVEEIKEKYRRKDLREKRKQNKKEYRERRRAAQVIVNEFIELYKETGRLRFLEKSKFYQRFMTNEQKNFVWARLQPEFGV